MSVQVTSFLHWSRVACVVSLYNFIALFVSFSSSGFFMLSR